EGGPHKVVTVQLTPEERYLRTTDSGADFEEGAGGPAGAALDEHLQVERRRCAGQCAQEGSGRGLDRLVDQRVVLLDGAEEGAVAETEAAVDVAGDPPAGQLTAGEHPVHVVDRVR